MPKVQKVLALEPKRIGRSSRYSEIPLIDNPELHLAKTILCDTDGRLHEIVVTRPVLRREVSVAAPALQRGEDPHPIGILGCLGLPLDDLFDCALHRCCSCDCVVLTDLVPDE